ncbi:hypothetical protein TI39_contig4171g00002 [Zymoseptoria brevis]|uniref:Uncharacterized protein n=1 Tax=Zymoseptoria brevis TaxID=1047168 RepID=A0A0F4GB68_9PEZI|nr:hypothetical protein TI39_contig4171g00002 [Zymoseptoria brevis]
MDVLEELVEQMRAAIPHSQERSHNGSMMSSSIASSPCPASRLPSSGNLQRASSAAPQHISSTSQGGSMHDPTPSSCTIQGDSTYNPILSSSTISQGDDTTEAEENTSPERALPASTVMQSQVMLNADGKKLSLDHSDNDEAEDWSDTDADEVAVELGRRLVTPLADVSSPPGSDDQHAGSLSLVVEMAGKQAIPEPSPVHFRRSREHLDSPDSDDDEDSTVEQYDNLGSPADHTAEFASLSRGTPGILFQPDTDAVATGSERHDLTPSRAGSASANGRDDERVDASTITEAAINTIQLPKGACKEALLRYDRKQRLRLSKYSSETHTNDGT